MPFKIFHVKSVKVENLNNLKRWQKHIEHLSKDKTVANQKETTIENVMKNFSKELKRPNDTVTKCQNVSRFTLSFGFYDFHWLLTYFRKYDV